MKHLSNSIDKLVSESEGTGRVKALFSHVLLGELPPEGVAQI